MLLAGGFVRCSQTPAPASLVLPALCWQAGKSHRALVFACLCYQHLLVTVYSSLGHFICSFPGQLCHPYVIQGYCLIAF